MTNGTLTIHLPGFLLSAFRTSVRSEFQIQTTFLLVGNCLCLTYIVFIDFGVFNNVNEYYVTRIVLIRLLRSVFCSRFDI